jgi:hypothetical protein
MIGMKKFPKNAIKGIAIRVFWINKGILLKLLIIIPVLALILAPPFSPGWRNISLKFIKLF